ncbi:hypothetical protein PIB30_049690 [Stylosanthes scabra]|uniref:Uncharacterized protein n=1 Tax=Stylosanthes scabra TaxID=79078 RepID=A0ABU6YIJ3_9FABA|nr:hypothetical protein [Stylosanthes scabra]
MNLSDFVVVTLYSNGEMGRDPGGIWFRSATPVVFQMQPVNTLEELKAAILRNMEVVGGTMLTVDGDIGGPSSSARGAAGVIPCSPIHFAAPDASMQLELNSDADSNEDFVYFADDSSENSDDTEFVPESQCRRNFLLPAPAPIPDLSSDAHGQFVWPCGQILDTGRYGGLVDHIIVWHRPCPLTMHSLMVD